MRRVDVGKGVMALHRKYIVNGEKPRMSFSATGTRSLHYDGGVSIPGSLQDRSTHRQGL